MKSTHATTIGLGLLTALCIACGTQQQDQNNKPDANAGESAKSEQQDSPQEETQQITLPEDWSPERWKSTGVPMVRPVSDKELLGPDDPLIAAGAEVDPAFTQDLWAIARRYRMWARTDDEAAWAPFLCRMPTPGQAAISEADGADGHARKLYYLYASDRKHYLGLRQANYVRPADGHLAVVKRAFKPQRVVDDLVEIAERLSKEGYLSPDESKRWRAQYQHDELQHLPPTVNDSGHAYIPGEDAGIFVLFKPGHHPDRTDEGWVYGTLSAQGEITACGKIESCMGCHEEAEHERLFGPMW